MAQRGQTTNTTVALAVVVVAVYAVKKHFLGLVVPVAVLVVVPVVESNFRHSAMRQLQEP